jgi:orotidine-5'-phosphate decarboxylase
MTADDLRRSLKNPVCLALDTGDWRTAESFLDRVGPELGMVKVGPVLFIREARRVSDWLSSDPCPIFLDFKWHDIPHTVAEAILGIPGTSVRLVTVHAQGGPAMIRAARDAAESRGKDRPLVLAVTLLTHLAKGELCLLGIKDRWDGIRTLGKAALDAGADGLVMAPGDVVLARREWGSDPFIVTPGIRFSRPEPGSGDDQILSETPARAIENGSDLLVVGRPILESPSPEATVRTILMECRKD